MNKYVVHVETHDPALALSVLDGTMVREGTQSRHHKIETPDGTLIYRYNLIDKDAEWIKDES